MTFIYTVPEDEATGATAEVYATDEQVFGYLPNFTLAFSLRPTVYAAWRDLNGAIKGGMDLRRYELATIAAARRLRSTYCTLAHGSVLLDKFLDADSVAAVVADHRNAGLSAGDVAVMDLAEKSPMMRPPFSRQISTACGPSACQTRRSSRLSLLPRQDASLARRSTLSASSRTRSTPISILIFATCSRLDARSQNADAVALIDWEEHPNR